MKTTAPIVFIPELKFTLHGIVTTSHPIEPLKQPIRPLTCVSPTSCIAYSCCIFHASITTNNSSINQQLQRLQAHIQIHKQIKLWPLMRRTGSRC
ncbi:hypothetical protein MAR_013032 [Mya arenaria]|uniref:Uncharacterized protein n=1 Tax=Mya arenaria TaxID=6604 RepID=A0ABY7FYP5_MYAAR|nr:hypothetical protein MAR_013032 [Mya arenaria]